MRNYLPDELLQHHPSFFLLFLLGMLLLIIGIAFFEDWFTNRDTIKKPRE